MEAEEASPEEERQFAMEEGESPPEMGSDEIGESPPEGRLNE